MLGGEDHVCWLALFAGQRLQLIRDFPSFNQGGLHVDDAN